MVVCPKCGGRWSDRKEGECCNSVGCCGGVVCDGKLVLKENKDLMDSIWTKSTNEARWSDMVRTKEYGLQVDTK